MTANNDVLHHEITIRVLCIVVLLVILVAGLWPFHAPKNGVFWLGGGNGVRFASHGCILSSGPYQVHGPDGESSGSIEILLVPPYTGGRRTILAFEGEKKTGSSFLLQQNGNALIIQRSNTDDTGFVRTAEFTLTGALPKRKPIYLTATLHSKETTVYLDGVLARTFSVEGSLPGGFTGRLVLGNSLTIDDTWQGEVLGLAIYDRTLTPVKIAERYAGWSRSGQGALAADERPIAVYEFSESQGNVIHNQLDSPPNLIVPSRYLLLRPSFLVLPWYGLHLTWGYWKDVAVNILGFVPFGFIFVAFFSTMLPARKANATTVLFGFLISLTIEVLQAFLPTRNSGANDLITNTLGTWMGVLLYRSAMIHTFLAKITMKKLASTRFQASE